MPPRGWRKPIVGDTEDPEGIIAWSERYLEHQRVRAYAAHTIKTTRGALLAFAAWAHEHGVDRIADVDRALVERYQASLFYARKVNGAPLSLSAQRFRLQKVRGLFRWLAKSGALPFNPAGEVDLPRLERRLPRAVLSEKEVELVMALPETERPTGLRDRAMLEVLYSTGIRRAELCALNLSDIDGERGTLMVRQGKGRKDRVVPVGDRALMWVDRYLEEARPRLIEPPGHDRLFVGRMGDPMTPTQLTRLVGRYIERADLGKTGSCHLLRHSMATLMLEGGADVRLIQEILGHAELSTTEIYTRVSIKHLKRVHDRTHPGAKLGRRKKTPPADEEG